MPPHRLRVSPHHEEAPLRISSSSDRQGGERMQTHQKHSRSWSRTVRGPPPQNCPHPLTAGWDAALPTTHVMRLICLRRYPAPPPLGIATITVAAAIAIAFCALVILPPLPLLPPPPPIPVPYHTAAIRVTTHMLWLVVISLPPPAMEDCSATNCKIGASQIQLIHLFRKWYRWNDCYWRVKVHSCGGRPLLLLW